MIYDIKSIHQGIYFPISSSCIYGCPSSVIFHAFFIIQMPPRKLPRCAPFRSRQVCAEIPRGESHIPVRPLRDSPLTSWEGRRHPINRPKVHQHPNINGFKEPTTPHQWDRRADETPSADPKGRLHPINGFDGPETPHH